MRHALNLPNTITVIRILLTPFFVILLQKQLYPHALVVFAVAALTDGLDGFLARTRNQRTHLGAFLDPIADKLLLMAAFLGLALMGRLPVWLAVITVSRDILIVLGIAVFTIVHIRVEIRPSWVSKATTCVQIATVIAALCDPALPGIPGVRAALFWLTAGVTIVSGGHYLVTGLATLQQTLGSPAAAECGPPSLGPSAAGRSAAAGAQRPDRRPSGNVADPAAPRDRASGRGE